MTDRGTGLVFLDFGFLVLTFWTVPNKLVNLSILRLEKWKNSYFPLFGTGSLVNHSGAEQRIKIINCCSALEEKSRKKSKKESQKFWLLPRWTHHELPTGEEMSCAVKDTCLILSKTQKLKMTTIIKVPQKTDVTCASEEQKQSTRPRAAALQCKPSDTVWKESSFPSQTPLTAKISAWEQSLWRPLT